MFFYAVLSLLLLIAIMPIVYLMIRGAAHSSLQQTCLTIYGILILVGLASVPCWFALLGIDISWLWIIWGCLVGATIGALAPCWPLLLSDSLQLQRKGYTTGLGLTHQNARETLDWASVIYFLTLLRFGVLTVPLGVLLGLGACLLAR